MSFLQAQGISRIYQTNSIFRSNSQTQVVLDDISIAINQGESVALLGRSGCGKSTLAKLLTGLDAPDKGEVFFNGTSLQKLSKASLRTFRQKVQMVFQDAVSAVNPRWTVGQIIAESLKPLCGLDGKAARDKVIELLHTVQLQASDYNKYPQQMSGGQLQRVCLARALAPQPELIILDEAVSNLDLNLQVKILGLLESLQQVHKVAYLFITHDLRLAQRFCQRVLVMSQGRLVEESAVVKNQALALTSAEGRALVDAVLPAFPAQNRFIRAQ